MPADELPGITNNSHRTPAPHPDCLQEKRKWFSESLCFTTKPLTQSFPPLKGSGHLVRKQNEVSDNLLVYWRPHSLKTEACSPCTSQGFP